MQPIPVPISDAMSAALTDWNWASARIHSRLLSTEYQAEKLQDLIQIPIAGDLALTFIVDLSDMQGMQHGTAAYVYPVMLNEWEVDLDDVIQVARANDCMGDYAPVIRPLFSVLQQITFGEFEETPDDVGIMVISNRQAAYGAGAILSQSAYNALHEVFPDGCLALPSSVHEFLAVPGNMDPDELARMVRGINRDVVEPPDILSDHVFRLAPGSLVQVI